MQICKMTAACRFIIWLARIRFAMEQSPTTPSVIWATNLNLFNLRPTQNYLNKTAIP